MNNPEATFREANRLARVGARLWKSSVSARLAGLDHAAEQIEREAEDVSRHAEQALMRAYSIADTEREY